MHTVKIAAVLVWLAGAPTVVAEEPGRTLLSTAAVAREIAALQGPQADSPADPGSLQARVAGLRRAVGRFVIRQLEAYPSLSGENLEKQLASAFGDPSNSWVSGPRVFAGPSGPKTTHRTFVVAYVWFGFYGKGGSETILESYEWDQGRGARLGAGLVPPLLSGFLTEPEKVCWFPGTDTYWLLVSGQLGGASGRVLGGSAAVFEIGPAQAKTVWTAMPGIGNVRAYVPFSGVPRWEVEYVATPASNVRLLDVFQVDYAKRTFRRLIHQPLD